MPGNICNLRCSYCYVTECLQYSHGVKAQFNYSVEHMIAAFEPKRIGGIAYITVIGGGETLIPQEAVRFLSFDVRKLFCYAGAWSFVVEMQTGMMSKCHNVQTEINFFEHIDAPIKCDPVGCECGIASCSLQYCFYGPGLIPEIPNVPTYTGLVASNSRLFNEEVKQLMD